MTTDPAIGGLQANDAIVGRRTQHRADGLGAQSDGAHSRGDGDGRTAAGTTRSVGRVPRIQGGRGVETGEFGGHRLAHHYCSGLLQTGQYGGVLVGHEVGVYPRAGRGRDSSRVEDVLDPHRDAVERARIGHGIQLALALLGVGQYGLTIYVYPGLQRFQGVGTGQQRLGRLHRADFAGTDLAGQLSCGKFV